MFPEQFSKRPIELITHFLFQSYFDIFCWCLHSLLCHDVTITRCRVWRHGWCKRRQMSLHFFQIEVLLMIFWNNIFFCIFNKYFSLFYIQMIVVFSETIADELNLQQFISAFLSTNLKHNHITILLMSKIVWWLVKDSICSWVKKRFYLL
jgi:hypothetical protein